MTRTRAVTGIAPLIGLDAGLAETWDWYRDRAARPAGALAS